MPELFEIVAANKDGYEHLPVPEVPYYVKADEGNFIHRATQIGTVLLPVPFNEMPKLGRVGFKNGVFNWSGEKIPDNIISQAHDFFKRIYAKHHAEAEVIITMNAETKQFRLFVPYQRVSHAGVKSIFEPTHISRGWDVVGTLHSHCDFSAFHSGTDSGDASDMDGVHFTIGHVNNDTPQIVAMVVMAGKEFHYSDPNEIAEIAYHTQTSPEWWDQFVWPGAAPEQKPKSLKSLTDQQWQEFLGRALVKPKQTYTAPNRPNGWVSPYANPKAGAQPIPASRAVVTRIHPERDWDKEDHDWRQWVYGGYSQPLNESKAFNRNNWAKDKTGIPELDAINEALDLAEESGAFTDADWTGIKASDIDETVFWQEFFANRIEAIGEVLQILGSNLEYSLTTINEGDGDDLLG